MPPASPFPRLPHARSLVSATALGLTVLLTPTALSHRQSERPVAAVRTEAVAVADPVITGSTLASGASDGGALETAVSTHLPALSQPIPVKAERITRSVRPPDSPVQPDIAAQKTIPLALPFDEIEAQVLTARPSVAGVGPDDLDLVKKALVDYRAGRIEEADALAARIDDEAARAALDWAAIRLRRQQAGFARLARFLTQYPAFPMVDWVRRRAEEALLVEPQHRSRVPDFFKTHAPEMAAGKVALAREWMAQGKTSEAEALVRSAWRENSTSQSLRALIHREFPKAVLDADIRHLAEKLILRGQTAEGVRVAALAGPAALELAQILSASVNETGGAMALIQKLDPARQGEAPVIFARVQHLRRAGQIASATQAMLHAPRDAAKLGDPDEWWIERRMMTRKALDSGDPASAYRIAAEHAAQAPHYKVDAEVHAGWVALRYLGKADVAASHFDRARAAAVTPHSLARAAYWQGRAAEALASPEAATHYAAAARHGHVYFGQLAQARLGEAAAAPDEDSITSGDLERATRSVGLRAIRVLLEADARDLAQPLIAAAANGAASSAEAMAVGDLAARFGLPRLTVLAGKSAMQRGLKMEEHAFPTFGIPPFEPTPDMAETAIVYSIARQESEFEPNAISHAGARGLMQLMPETARRTASKAKLPFDVASLTANPALNARIGATHLGELLEDYNGSYILTFAAYNAGGKRVKEWITAYGDPRDPKIDPVDWIERIPFTETRQYVQKVLENVQVYRQRLKQPVTPGILADLARGARPNRADLALTEAPPGP